MSTASLVAVLVTATSGPTPRPSPHLTASHPATAPTEPAGLVADPSGDTMLAFLLAVVVAGYLLSLKLHPFSKCPRCKGKAIHRGSFYTYATRPCTKCGGRGVQERLGRRLFSSAKT